MKRKDWMIIMMVCLLTSSCATSFNKKFVQPHIVEPYKQEAKELPKNLLKIHITPAHIADPIFFGVDKGYDLISFALAPVMVPFDKYIVEKMIKRPLNRYVIWPLVGRPLNWVGRKTGLLKERPTRKQLEWFERKPLYTLLDGPLSTDRDPFLPYRFPKEKKEIKTEPIPKKEPRKELNKHSVKKGQCLWLIAQKYYGRGNLFLRIAKANNIKAPYTILVGQSLLIPKDSVQLKPRPKPKAKLDRKSVLKHYKHVGANPYTGTAKWAIEHFDLPSAVKQKALSKINQGNFEWFNYPEGGLQSGQIIEQLTFGHNIVSDNWICDWSDQKYEAAKDYGFEHQGKTYRIIQILKCNNWAWWTEERAIPTVQATKPEQPATEKVVSFKPANRQSRFYLEPHWEVSSGGFMERFEDKTDVYGRWHIFSFYPFVYKDSKGRKHQFGAAIENIWWKGSTRDRFAFEGGKDFMIGPSYKLNTPDSETYARLLFGKREDKGFIHNRRSYQDSFGFYRRTTEKYKMRQNSSIISFYLSHERWRHGNKKWFRKIRFYTLNDFDIGHSKRAEFRAHNDKTNSFFTKDVESKSDNKDMISAGFWLEIYDYKNGLARPQLGFEIKHYLEGHKTGFRPAIGLTFLNDAFFIGANYTAWNKHYPNAWGLECWVDGYKLYKYIKERRWRGQAEKLNYEELEVLDY